MASFGGIDLNSSSVDPIDYSIAVIESRDFLKRIIEIEKVKENLAAARSYDPNTRQSIYRSSVFDASNQTWIKDVHFMRIHSRHYLKNLTLTKDRATGFLTVTFRHPNPIFAKDFVQLIIDELNSSIRAIELENSEKKLEFLIQRLQYKYGLTSTKGLLRGVKKTAFFYKGRLSASSMILHTQ